MNLVIRIELVLSFFNPFKVIPNCHLVLENKCKIGRSRKRLACKYFQEKQSTKKKAGSLLERVLKIVYRAVMNIVCT